MGIQDFIGRVVLSTLANATLAAAAVLTHKGVAAHTLGDATLGATGRLTHKASVSATLASIQATVTGLIASLGWYVRRFSRRFR